GTRSRQSGRAGAARGRGGDSGTRPRGRRVAAQANRDRRRRPTRAVVEAAPRTALRRDRRGAKGPLLARLARGDRAGGADAPRLGSAVTPRARRRAPLSAVARSFSRRDGSRSDPGAARRVERGPRAPASRRRAGAGGIGGLPPRLG